MRTLALLISAAALALPSLADEEVAPGKKLPPEIAERAKPFLAAGKAALLAKDAAAVRAAVAQVIEAMGPWAGNPERATVYYPPIDRSAFDAGKVRAYWLAEVERGSRGVPWKKNPRGDPKLMEAGLREAAIPLAAVARTIALVPDHAEEWTRLVRGGADWLMARQHAGGGFPMPVGPALHPREKVGFMMKRLLEAHPDMEVDGWIPDDRGDGGLQFDNGLCGRALIEAWELTDDARYRDSACRAADWALAQPMVANWNYNAFSAGLLARAACATANAKYLAAAVEKARVGVLPGQMKSGRWFDPHNACAVYHNILLRELLEVFAVLPERHEFRGELREALVRGLGQAADETLAHGFGGVWSANFARALTLLGENQKWREALNVCVNAALSGRALTLGPDAVAVLELDAGAGLSRHQRAGRLLLAAQIAPAPAREGQLRDLEYARIGERSLKLDLYLPKPAATPPRLIVYVHGGAWRAGSKDEMPLDKLVEQWFAIASVDYRLSPEAPFPAQAHDIKAAIRYLRAKAPEHGYDAAHLAIAGSSAGGHLAALVGLSNGVAALEGTVGEHLGQSSSVQGVISLFGASNLQTILAQSTEHGLKVRVPALQLLLGGPPPEKPELARLASPVAHVDPADPPVLLIHGDADPQMPVEQTHELARVCQEAKVPVQTVILPGSKHGGAEFYDEVRTALMAEFLRKIP